MKTIAYFSLFILFLTLGFSACNENSEQKAPLSKRMELDSTSRYSDQNYKVYTLEGCEYVVVGYGKDRWGSHKGTCKNPIHYNDTIKK